MTARSAHRSSPRKRGSSFWPPRRRGNGKSLGSRIRRNGRGWGSLAALLAAALAAPALASYDIPPIEPVYAVSAAKAGLTVRLASNGCTRKSDLTVAVSNAPPRPLVLIARRHADQCRSLGAGHVDVVWSYEELGLKSGEAFSLANPLVADPSP